jgi:ABC-type transporter Mla MlaB component
MATSKKHTGRSRAGPTAKAAAARSTSPASPASPAPPADAATALVLGSSLSIRDVKDRALQLRAMLDSGRATVDARSLESIDTAGIQLLLCAALAAQRRGFKLQLLGAERLQNGAASVLGVSEQLALAVEALP